MIYEIADLRIDIQNRCAFTTRFCAEYLSKDQDTPAHFSVHVTEEQFRAEKALGEGFSDGYIENICLYRNLCLEALRFNKILLHSCVVSYDGKGYAFLGKSGTGKSTHSRLWLKYLPESFIVNGDKPILSLEGDVIYAHGTPWMGKEGLGCNAKVPLAGLCFLRQAKQNKLKKLSTSEAVHLLFGQILLPQEEQNAVKTLELADQILQNVPAYLLDCDISQEAVKTSFEGLTNQKFSQEEEK